MSHGVWSTSLFRMVREKKASGVIIALCCEKGEEAAVDLRPHIVRSEDTEILPPFSNPRASSPPRGPLSPPG